MSDDITLPAMSKSEAWELTDEIRQGFETIHQNRMEQVERLARAYEGRAWEAMGYDSFDEYHTEEFGEDLQHQRLELEERMGMVKVLADSGMAKTKIAEILGVSRMTVHRDLAAQPAGVTDVTSSGLDTAGQSVEEAGHIDEGPSPAQEVTVDETDRNQEVQNSEESDEERQKRLDAFFAGIDFDKMIIPTPTQIIEADPTPETPEYFASRQDAPSWSPPQVQPLPPPPTKAYDEQPGPEVFGPTKNLEDAPKPHKDDTKHCKTCACNLLP